jgi:muconolactone D-isomerase
MDWLVEVSVCLPSSMSSEEVEQLTEAERVRGRELVASGSIQQIWRVPGALANVGIWRADTATELHAAISSLPLWRWLEVEVTPLADHPLTSETVLRSVGATADRPRPALACPDR